MDVVIGIVGWSGTVLLLVAYALLTTRTLRPRGVPYQAMNLLGGLALMVNSAYYSAWPSAALNLAWVGIGMVGLLSRARRTEKSHRVAGAADL